MSKHRAGNIALIVGLIILSVGLLLFINLLTFKVDFIPKNFYSHEGITFTFLFTSSVGFLFLSIGFLLRKREGENTQVHIFLKIVIVNCIIGVVISIAFLLLFIIGWPVRLL